MLSKQELKALDKVLQLKNKVKVENFFNRNQFVITLENALIFQSYKSTIAILYNNTLYIDSYYINYSKTTSKHLYLFIKEYTYFDINNLKDLQKEIKNGGIKTY